MTDFKKDLKLSQKKEIIAAFDRFYKEKYGNNIRIERYDKNQIAQRDFSCDVILELPNGIKFSIDEKLRRFKYKDNPFYPIETIKNVELNKKGWLFNTMAGYICFGQLNETEDDLLSCFKFPIDLHFKTFILHKINLFNQYRTSTNGLYHTEFITIHFSQILAFAGYNNCHQFGLERYEI